MNCFMTMHLTWCTDDSILDQNWLCFDTSDDELRANDAASSCWLDPTPKPAKWRHHNRREISETTPHSFHLNLSLTFSPRWRPRPVKRHPPSDPASSPPRVSPSNLSSASSPSVIEAGIEPPPGPVQDPCSICGNRVHLGWISFLCMVCDQWCHRRCSGIHSQADYRRLAPRCCLTYAPPPPVPPATPTREPESSDLERMRSALSSGEFLSHRFLSIGPSRLGEHC